MARRLRRTPPLFSKENETLDDEIDYFYHAPCSAAQKRDSGKKATRTKVTTTTIDGRANAEKLWELQRELARELEDKKSDEGHENHRNVIESLRPKDELEEDRLKSDVSSPAREECSLSFASSTFSTSPNEEDVITQQKEAVGEDNNSGNECESDLELVIRPLTVQSASEKNFDETKRKQSEKNISTSSGCSSESEEASSPRTSSAKNLPQVNPCKTPKC